MYLTPQVVIEYQRYLHRSLDGLPNAELKSSSFLPLQVLVFPVFSRPPADSLLQFTTRERSIFSCSLRSVSAFLSHSSLRACFLALSLCSPLRHFVSPRPPPRRLLPWWLLSSAGSYRGYCIEWFLFQYNLQFDSCPCVLSISRLRLKKLGNICGYWCIIYTINSFCCINK